MKHSPLPLPISHTRAPYSCARVTVVLIIAIVYAAGLFTGAIVFGEILIGGHPS